MADTYPNYESLAAAHKEGIDYRREAHNRGTEVVIIAPHGGGIERGTSEIVEAIAGRDLSFYKFEGVRPRGNGIFHITSTNFDEPMCCSLIASASCVIAIHGDSSQSQFVYLGDRDFETIARIQKVLTKRGFLAKLHPDSTKRAVSIKNICNRSGTGRGVQLEISEGLRKTFFPSLKRAGRAYPTQKFGDFVNAIRDAIDRNTAYKDASFSKTKDTRKAGEAAGG